MALAGCILIAAACSKEASRSSGVRVRDSAGVEIVEHPDSLPALERWTVDPTPILAVGDTIDPNQLFTGAQYAKRTDDGSLVVVDQSAKPRATESLVKLFDSTGRFLRNIGGFGDGPGEFRWVSWLGVSRDSILIYVGERRVLQYFLHDGRHVRDVSFSDRPAIAAFTIQDRYPCGDFLVDVWKPGPQPKSGEVARRPVTLARLPLTGPVLDTVGTFPGEEQGSVRTEIKGGFMERQVPIAFPLRLSYAAAGDVLYVGTQERYEISGYSPTGKLQRIIRRQTPRRPVTAEIKAAYEADEGAWKNPRYPATLPGHGAFRGDAAGNLWVGEYRLRPGNVPPIEWIVFGTNGIARARATISDSLYVTEIGEDHVTAIVRDADDVQRVFVYRLRRGQ